MSTNYYAYRKPSEEKKKALIDLINESRPDQYSEILDAANLLYGSLDRYNKDAGIIHLGKRASGWKFLWCTNYWETDEGYWDASMREWIPNIVIHNFYELTKESIYNFIMRDDIIVCDEYGDVQDKEDFWNMALNWCVDGWDHESYSADNPERAGLCSWDFAKQQQMYKSLGFEFNNSSVTDFYSDGLRFSIHDDFS